MIKICPEDTTQLGPIEEWTLSDNVHRDADYSFQPLIEVHQITAPETNTCPQHDREKKHYTDVLKSS